jgi:C4-dicarboxylate-specific signal transduction histidine kinase
MIDINVCIPQPCERLLHHEILFNSDGASNPLSRKLMTYLWAAALLEKAKSCFALAKVEHETDAEHQLAARQTDNAKKQHENADAQEHLAATQHKNADQLDTSAGKMATLGRALTASATELGDPRSPHSRKN